MVGKLPAGNYTYLFIAEQASESEAEQVVAKVTVDKYNRYDAPPYLEYAYGNAKNSLRSLIRANFPNHADFNHIVLLKN